MDQSKWFIPTGWSPVILQQLLYRLQAGSTEHLIPIFILILSSLFLPFSLLYWSVLDSLFLFQNLNYFGLNLCFYLQVLKVGEITFRITEQ